VRLAVLDEGREGDSGTQKGRSPLNRCPQPVAVHIRTTQLRPQPRFDDPEHRLAFACVMNRMEPDVLSGPKALQLVEAVSG
jgi:hypothetical protein